MKSGSFKLLEPKGLSMPVEGLLYLYHVDTTSDRLSFRPSVTQNTRLNTLSDFHENLKYVIYKQFANKKDFHEKSAE